MSRINEKKIARLVAHLVRESYTLAAVARILGVSDRTARRVLFTLESDYIVMRSKKEGSKVRFSLLPKP